MNNKDLLNLIDITVSFEGFLALNKLNLNLKKGELRAVIGPNGAGKTTFLDVITGKVKPTKGEVIFKGKSLVGRKEHKIARLGVGRKFQSPRIFENLTVKENLEISVTTPKSPLNLKNKTIKDDQLNEIDRLMKIVNLALKVDSKAGALYTVQSGIVSPQFMTVPFAIEMVIWVAVGGRGTLLGAILGAVFINYAKSLVSEALPASWMFIQGGLFILVVTALPEGVLGWIQGDGPRNLLQRFGLKRKIETYPSLEVNNKEVSNE